MNSKRKKAFDKYGGACGYCGCEITEEGFVMDHIHPKSKGGKDGLYNIMPACEDCDKLKGSMTLEEFRSTLTLVQRKFRQDILFRVAEKHGLIDVNELNGKRHEFYFEALDELRKAMEISNMNGPIDRDQLKESIGL